jgi:sporulation protein YlmC with PRC-barrel domain
MKQLLLASACAALFASGAFAQSTPDAQSPSASSPSLTAPSSICPPGQVLQPNGQPCAASPSSSSSTTAQAPSATPSTSPSSSSSSTTIVQTPPSGPVTTPPSSTAQAPSSSPSLSASPPSSTAQAPSASTLPSAPSVTITASSSQTFIDQQGDNQYLASNIMGKAVVNSAGDKIGSVKDILFDDQGKMTAVIIGVGGFLGIGEKSVAISFDMVKPSKDANGNLILTASLDKDAVNAAPSFMTLEDLKARAPSSNAPSPSPAAPAAR